MKRKKFEGSKFQALLDFGDSKEFSQSAKSIKADVFLWDCQNIFLAENFCKTMNSCN